MGDTKVTVVSSYNEFGSGDVIFKVENPVAECLHDFWLTKSDAGFNTNMALILSAYQA